MIVAGLNHTLHRVQETNILNEKIEAAGYNPNDAQNMTPEEIKLFAEKVFGVDYVNAGNPNFDYDANLGANGQVQIRNGFFTGKIMLASYLKGTFYKYIGGVIGHELQHAIDYTSGNLRAWQTQYKNKDIVRALTENNAYNWELKNGSMLYNADQHQYWQNILKLNDIKF